MAELHHRRRRAQRRGRPAPHPNTARLFQDWSVSAEGQAEWLNYITAGLGRSDVADPRRQQKKDWFAEAWYQDPKSLYTAFLKEPAFADPKKPVIAEWNQIMGYQGK